MGNLRSVVKAFEHVGALPTVSSDPAEIAAAEALVLPGVGAFPEAMREIAARGLAEPIRSRAEAGVPRARYLPRHATRSSNLRSSTSGAVGLGLLEGTVEPIRAPGLKLPHIGWAPVRRSAIRR